MKKFYEEFKEFLSKGNLFELAIAFIVGASVKQVIDSLVKYLFMPLINFIAPSKSFEEWKLSIGNIVFHYGHILAALLNFLIIGLVAFIMLKALTKLKKQEKEETKLTMDQELLVEIRDLLKSNHEKK